MTGAAQLAGSFALVAAVALLCAGRARTALHLCALQALLAAAAYGARGPGWAAIALVAFALNGVALPLILARLSDQRALAPVIAMRGGMTAWLAALALLLVSVVTFAQAMPGGVNELLAAGSSIVVLGLLLAAQRAHPLAQAVGLLSSQNGIILVAAASPDLPLTAVLAFVVPFVPAMMAANAWLRR